MTLFFFFYLMEENILFKISCIPWHFFWRIIDLLYIVYFYMGYINIFFSLFFEFLNFISFIFLYSRFFLVMHFIHISVYMSISISQFITPPPPPPATFPPWCPYVCSLHLCLNFCPENRFLCTIFLGSTYMHYYTIFVFLFLTYLTLYDSI